MGLELCHAGLELCHAGLELCHAGLELCHAGLELCHAGLELLQLQKKKTERPTAVCFNGLAWELFGKYSVFSNLIFIFVNASVKLKSH